MEEERATKLFNLQVAQGARDKEKHAASMDKEKSRVCASKEDLRDGIGDANKRALAAGLGYQNAEHQVKKARRYSARRGHQHHIPNGSSMYCT